MTWRSVVADMRRTLLLAPLLLAAPLAAQLPIPEAVQANVRARVDQALSVGIVIGVVDAAGTRYFAYGNTAMQGGRPVDEHSIYEIGSITKVFTAVALTDMVVRGEVSLDDPVERYLPAGSVVPRRGGRQITLRLLSAQQSGLPRMPTNFAPADQSNPFADYDEDRLLAFLRGHELSRDPGERYEYSNVGVGLLGFALARRDGGSYERMIERRILAPLGMRESMVTLTPEAQSRLAMGHSGGRQVPSWDINALAGAGALRSTAADMTRFLAAAMGLTRSPLDSAFALSFTPQGSAGGTMDIALGWHILKRPTLNVVWHNGGTGGNRTWAGFDPARKIGVVVLTNSTSGADVIGVHLLDPTIPLSLPASAR